MCIRDRILYAAVVLVFPGYGGLRYFVPVFPLYVFYAFFALDGLLRSPGARAAGLALLILAAGATYASKYTTKDYGPIVEGPEKRESVELFEFVKNEMSSDDVVIFFKPRVMALYGERRSAAYQPSRDTRAIMNFIDDIGAAYIVAGPFREDKEYLAPLISEYSYMLEEVFSNGDFTVYRILNESRAVSREAARFCVRSFVCEAVRVERLSL